MYHKSRGLPKSFCLQVSFRKELESPLSVQLAPKQFWTPSLSFCPCHSPSPDSRSCRRALYGPSICVSTKYEEPNSTSRVAHLTQGANCRIHFTNLRNSFSGTCLVVQWLRFCAFNTGGGNSIPGWGTEIHVPCGVAKKKKKKETKKRKKELLSTFGHSFGWLLSLWLQNGVST